MRRAAGLGLVLLAALALRLPFWWQALHTGVDGDTAIVGLMARHPTRSTTLWGQPYGSPLDGWVAAPFVAVLGATTAALRIPYALLALGLVWIAYRLGEAALAGAGLAAGLLVACPPAYVLLLSALPPPLYPTTLVLLGVVLVLAIDVADRLASGAVAPRGRLAALGGLAGLAVWTHLMSLTTVVAVAATLLLAARRVRGAGRALAGAAVAFALASAAWWVRALREPAATAVLGLSYGHGSPFAHAASVARHLHEPIAALVGAWTPLTADEGERWVRVPTAVGLGLGAGWAMAAGAGLRAVSARVRWLLAGTIALTVAAYPFPVRSDPHTVRFLTPALVPLSVLAAAGAVRTAGRARAWLVVLPLCAAQLWTGALLLSAWRRLGPDALVPDCAPALDALVGHGVWRAYASYHAAYCLTWASGEAVVASQPWNERFYGQPLPYLDEVRFSPRAAWVLDPGADFELPAPRTFESKLAGIGASYRRLQAGHAIVYLDFVPPFGAGGAAGAVAGRAGDGEVSSRAIEPSAGGTTVPLARPMAARGVTLLAAPDAPRLPMAMDVEASSDGVTFERVGRRRRGRETVDLAWINGHPQFLVDDLAFSTPLDGRMVAALRITSADGGTPWGLGWVIVHPVAAPRPWAADVPGGSWAERRAALAARPEPADAGWLYRSLLARLHP